MKGRNKTTMKSIRSALKVLPYYSCSGNLAEIHGQFNNSAGVSYTGSEIINVHKTKEQREHNKTLFPNPNQNNNGSFVLRHLVKLKRN